VHARCYTTGLAGPVNKAAAKVFCRSVTFSDREGGTALCSHGITPQSKGSDGDGPVAGLDMTGGPMVDRARLISLSLSLSLSLSSFSLYLSTHLSQSQSQSQSQLSLAFTLFAHGSYLPWTARP
jgi:hypothetical protein